MEWLNIYGLAAVLLILAPNVVYACKFKGQENLCANRCTNIGEQAGRYGSMFFMVFNIGIAEFGFASDEIFAVWLTSISVLTLLYWVFWIFYFKSEKFIISMSLAIIPSIIFILSGFLSRHWLLLAFGIVFSVGHIFVTYANSTVTRCGK